MTNLDILVGVIREITPAVDQTQTDIKCDSGTYLMSNEWCAKHTPTPGAFLVLSYDGFYKCKPADSLTYVL